MPGFAGLHFVPASAAANIVPAESDSLVVVWIQREDAFKHLLGLRELPQAPEAQSVTVQAAQKRPIVDMSPLQQATPEGGNPPTGLDLGQQPPVHNLRSCDAGEAGYSRMLAGLRQNLSSEQVTSGLPR